MPASIFAPAATTGNQSQIAALQAQMAGLQGSTGFGNYAQDANDAQQLNALNAQNAATNDPFNQYRTQLLGLGNSELSNAQNNPLDQQIQSALSSQIQSGGPYTPQVQATMDAQQSDMSAATEKGQLSQVAANGLSPTDPAYQSRVSELEANRAGANQSAFANTANTAALGNWNAEEGALGQANSFSSALQGREMGASQNLQGILGSWSEPVASGGQINRPGASQTPAGPTAPAGMGSLAGSGVPAWGGGGILGSGSGSPGVTAPGSTGGNPYAGASGAISIGASPGSSPTDYTGGAAQGYGTGSQSQSPPSDYGTQYSTGTPGGGPPPQDNFNAFRKIPQAAPQSSNPFVASAAKTNPFMGS
jgi:hypothetical protein